MLGKIHVLDSAEKGNDYRGGERGLATLHVLVPWGTELLAFLLFFFRDGDVRLLLSSCYSPNQRFTRGVHRFFSELILRGKTPNIFCQNPPSFKERTLKNQLNTYIDNI